MVWQQYRQLDQEPRTHPRREDSQLVLRNLSQQGKFYTYDIRSFSVLSTNNSSLFRLLCWTAEVLSARSSLSSDVKI
jgi:hypothetical protein